MLPGPSLRAARRPRPGHRGTAPAPTRRAPLLALLLLPLAAACATGGAAGAGAPLPVPSESARWPVRPVEHVDLWLHTFALLDTDSSAVPLFARGYRDSLVVLRNAARVYTGLDSARADLAARLLAEPGLVGAQFLAFQFPSWEAMRAAADLFARTDGDPRQAGDQRGAAVVAYLGRQFPSAADRAWFGRLVAAAESERTAFFGAWWAEAQRLRRPVLEAVDLLWQGTYRERFGRLLGATNQRFGTFVPSLPLGPEGRATPESTDGRPMIAVPFPGRPEDAREAILGFAHEAVGGIAQAAVADNTTPAQKRDGTAARMLALAQVIAGRQFLARVAPELEADYVRYYLAQGGHALPAGDALPALRAALAETHPVPEIVEQAMARQFEIVLGGI